MKDYAGYRPLRSALVIPDDAGSYPLRPRNDLANHSPDGFEWGYEGSGPAQLALAILADLLEDEARALRLYQGFKREVIAKLPRDRSWRITEGEIRACIERLEEAEGSK